MSDIVFIEGLQINTLIGVYSWERAIKQQLIIDAEMVCDMTRAIKDDDVAHVINYKTVCEDMERLCHEIQAELLETLADKIADHVLRHYPCSQITLIIHKPNAIKDAKSVGVKIVRKAAV
ncbi:dihydroneopterin aldolase [Moraxella sp. FZFQ2102]|uniref:dihydroneopterin aldolase n=1 Tax=Moraxella sp. FZFQ2102 TaxID=2953752 RepID=UPI00209C13F1|nr:dihydroneopterin aldolase [Moraxella sp. FZFQ2102]USZ14885.1 dihydroneopterin aldolase [Moraxella sp. FZFQ2102]